LTRLLGADHDVLVADSGKEALTLLEKDRAFDLVLCDLMMADVSGVDLHAWLAQTDPALARQVVFMSGGVFVPKVADYLGRVGNLRIAKPFDAAHLKRLVPELVLAARGKRGAART
jgi:CheY-like chemotaxis protein